MSSSSTRIAVFALTLVLLAAFAGVLVWRSGQRDAGGWAGVLFLPAFDVAERPELQGLPGLVVWIDPRSPALSAGLDTGDTIVSIDGVPLADLDRLRELRGRQGPRSTLVYEVTNARGTDRLEVELAPAPGRSDLYGRVVTAAVGIVFLLTGAYVLVAASPRAGARVFYLMCALGAAGFFVEALGIELLDLSGFEPLAASPLCWTVLAFYLVQLVVLTNLLLHYSLIYPARRQVVSKRPRIFLWLHGLALWPFPVLALIAAVAGHAPVSWLLLLGVGAGVLLVYLVVVVLVYSGLTCGAFYRGYREGSLGEKRQILWPLWGTVAAFGLVVLLAVLGFVVALVPPASGLPSWAVGPARIFYVLIPVSFAVGFLKRRLEAIDRILQTTVVYGGAAGIVVLAWLVAVVPLAYSLLRRPDLPGRAITAGATLVLAAFFFPLRSVVEGWVERRRER